MLASLDVQMLKYNIYKKICLMSLYLAVWDDIELLTDLIWENDTVFFRRQRMRGGQGINCKYSVDVVKYYQVFLEKTEVYLDNFIKCEKYIQRSSNAHHIVFSPPSTQAQHGLLPGKTHMKQSLHSARPHSTSAESPGYQTTAPQTTSFSLFSLYDE